MVSLASSHHMEGRTPSQIMTTQNVSNIPEVSFGRPKLSLIEHGSWGVFYGMNMSQVFLSTYRGHLDGFQYLAIRNGGAVSVLRHVFFEHGHSFLLGA